MDASWTHPKLGEFTYDEDVNTWVGEVATPAFDAFAYDPGYTAAGAYELSFEAEDERDKPSAAAVTLAERVIGSADAIVPMVTAALWDDFNGRGPESGMYWHGDLGQVVQGMEDEGDLPPPKKAADLLKLIGHPGITVHKKVFYHDKPIVELSYAVAFEGEHGLGILTDGTAIIGIGYSSDVTPFKKSKRKAPPKKAKRKR